MIRVDRPEEPPTFDERVRKRGGTWLREHRGAARPRDYWSEFRDDLMKAFGERCGYTALHDLHGTVDHFDCYKYAPDRAHEWSNLRYATASRARSRSERSGMPKPTSRQVLSCTRKRRASSFDEGERAGACSYFAHVAINADALPASAQKRFALLRRPSEADVARYHRDYRVEVIACFDHDDMAALLEALVRT